jgi:hypothetical protein
MKTKRRVVVAAFTILLLAVFLSSATAQTTKAVTITPKPAIVIVHGAPEALVEMLGGVR